MEKRFISGLASQWNADKSGNELKYANSIVFIKNDTDKTKGDAIFAQGAYFEMNNVADVQNIINEYLKNGTNTEVVVDGDSLKINALSLATISGLTDTNKSKLVEAQAVKDALTTPVELKLTVEDGVASFAESFKTLEGGDKTATATTAVLKEGELIEFTADGGLKISHATITQAADKTSTETLSATDKVFTTNIYDVDKHGHVIGKTVHSVTLPDTAFSDTTYSAGTGLTLAEGNVFNHTNSVEGVSLTNAEMANQTPTSSAPSFKFKTYAYDDQGHVIGSKDATVELPATAFKDTTYEVTMAAGNSNEVSLNTKKDGKAESTYTIKGDKGTTVSFTNNVMTISSDTASDILGTLNVTDTAVANEYVSEVDQTNGKISITRAKLPVHGVNTTSVDGIKLSLTDGQVGLVDDGLAADLTSKNITLETAETATAGYLKTYVLKQGDNEIGKIDLPKELVVTGGSVVEKDGEKYLRLTIANQDEPVDIAVKDLVDVYTAGNGIAISDANVVSAKVKTGETYLKVSADGLYTEGIDTAITNAINALDVTGATVGSVATGTDTVNVIDSLTWSETDGKVSITGTTASAATKTYVDGKFNALDATLTADGASTEHVDGYTNVITGINQVDGLVSISSTASLPTDVEVARQAAKATTEVVKAAGSDSYLTITETVSEEDEHTIYTVGVSGIDTAIANATTTGTIENQGTNGTYNFVKTKDGLMTAADVASLMNEAWAWGTI